LFPKFSTLNPVIGLFFQQLKNKEPLKIVGDGLQRRDFINVKDIVEANFFAQKNIGDIFKS
jgi:nucleoside-diphosphate-sugar epimerase